MNSFSKFGAVLANDNEFHTVETNSKQCMIKKIEMKSLEITYTIEVNTDYSYLEFNSKNEFTDEDIILFCDFVGLNDTVINEFCLTSTGFMESICCKFNKHMFKYMILCGEREKFDLNRCLEFATSRSINDILTFYISYNLNDDGEYILSNSFDFHNHYIRMFNEFNNSFINILNLTPEQVNFRRKIHTFGNVYITPTILKHMHGVRTYPKLTDAALSAIHGFGTYDFNTIYLEVKGIEVCNFNSELDMNIKLNKVNLVGIQFCTVGNDIDILEKDVPELIKKIKCNIH